MRKIIYFFLGGVILLLFLSTTVFLYKNSQEKPIIYETVSPITTNIFKKTVATGKIIPRREIEIKSQVSGVVQQLFLEPGDSVKKDQLIAKIEIIPNMERLNTAEANVETARLNAENATRELNRQRKLATENLISDSEYNKFLLDSKIKQEALAEAQSNLAIIRDGASKKADKVANLVRSTINGLVLDIPVKEGSFVTETNNFNSGTTIANIANMQDMIFEGNIDEAQVGRISEGMPLTLKIGALENTLYQATLEYISPKGTDDNGTIKFQIRAAVKLLDNTFLRAGYSANAEIILDKREQVLAINESTLLFEGDKTFVEVETSPQTFAKREIRTGLSDGINIEVLSGITADARLKKI